MTTTTKQPNLDSAAIVARTISRALKTRGFTRAQVINKSYWTEGFYVNRVGCGSSVNVDYHVHGTYQHDKDRARRFAKRDELKAALTEMGYVSSHPTAIYIECHNS